MVQPSLFSPPATAGVRWLDMKQAGDYFGRSPVTCRHWCEDGTFEDFGYVIYRRTGKWFVGVREGVDANKAA